MVLKYSKWLNKSIWPIDGTFKGMTTSDQSGLGNEKVLYILQNFRTGASPADKV